MNQYRQLTLEQRYQIYALLKAGHPKAEIARIIDTLTGAPVSVLRAGPNRVSPRTCGGRSKRSSTSKGSPNRSQARMPSKASLRSATHGSTGEFTGTRARAHSLPESSLQPSLSKKYGRYNKRGKLVNQASIEERPVIVFDEKSRIGDRELDTLLAKRSREQTQQPPAQNAGRSDTE